MSFSKQIAIASLPLGGSVPNLYDFGFVDIQALSFLDIVDYVRNRPNGEGILNEYETFMYNIQVLKRKVPLWAQLYWPDLLYVTYLMWSLSVSPDFSFNMSYICPKCSYSNSLKIGLSSIQFKEYTGPAFIIEAGEQHLKGWFRRGLEIERKIHEYVSRVRGNLMPLDVAVLMMSLEIYDQDPHNAEQLIKEATHDVAYQLIDYLYYMTHPITPIEHTCANPNCRHTSQVPFYFGLERDFFLIFISNRGPYGISDELGRSYRYEGTLQPDNVRYDNHVQQEVRTDREVETTA